MTRGLFWVAALGAMMPVAVEIPAANDDTTGARGETRLRVAAGTGSYAFVARGCEGQVVGQVPVDFHDASAALEHRFGGIPLLVGVRGGVIEDRIGRSEGSLFPEVPEDHTVTTRYVNPYVSLEQPESGFGLGWVAHEGEFLTAGEQARTQSSHPLNDLSVHFRIGHLDRVHFLAQWMESEPLYSGGGYLTVTVGGPVPNSKLELRGGMSAGGPYEGAGLIVRASYPVTEGLRVDLRGRGGASGGKSAAGVGVGLEFTR